MLEGFMKGWHKLVWVTIICFIFSSCGGKKGEVITPDGQAEPDKILYEKGLDAVSKSKFDVARLVFQNLLNTYPDSEYQERAKLAIADAFFKEGGTSGLLQAKAEYMDFITFFPTSGENDDAQLRIAMTHYRQMEKPDRDPTQARAAEKELKAFVDDYPDSPLVDEASQYLRDVQEVLGFGDLSVARVSYDRRNYTGAFRRAANVIRSYPDFSRQDEALYVLGRVSEKRKNIIAAGYYYGLIVRYHPLSRFESESRKMLEKLDLPIPETDLMALNLARSEVENLDEKSLIGRFASMFTKRPDVSRARKATRPPIALGPEKINLDPTGITESESIAPLFDVPPINSVGVKILTPTRSKKKGDEKEKVKSDSKENENN